MASRALVTLLLGLVACGIPRDPAGTTERVRGGGTLRAGFARNPPWVELDGGAPSGREIEIVTAFAEALGAEVRWTEDAQGDLLDALAAGRLDLVVGGLREPTCRALRVACTRPLGGRDGHPVIALRKGENRLLLELEHFLERRRGAGAGSS